MSKTLDTDLYCFGVEYGDGTDDNHFHVGFTCKPFSDSVILNNKY